MLTYNANVLIIRKHKKGDLTWEQSLQDSACHWMGLSPGQIMMSNVSLPGCSAATKKVGVGGADITRQCLELGLLDEIQIDLVPVLLGQGVRLFEYLGIEPIELEKTGMSESPGVTHLSFRVVK